MNSNGPFSEKIDLALADTLKQGLIEQGFELTTPPYTLFSGKKKGVVCSLYTSGKLVVQGKDKDEFIEFFLEPHILKNLSYSHAEHFIDKRERLGVDEAGKGDFFGPLCVGAVFANAEMIDELHAIGVKDSKKMSDKVILTLATKIKKICPYHVVMINPQKYNEIYPKFRNLNSMLAWGHATAIEALVEETNCSYAIIDKFANESVVIDALKRKGVSLELDQRTKGENDLVVAAASILARAAFVNGLEKLSQMINSPLPKGASAQVVAAGKRIFQNLGEETLFQVAKKHFKTWNEVCSTG